MWQEEIMFKTIEENISTEIVEKKSKFIGHLYAVESVEQAEELIKQANKKYFDARHNCYAFCVTTETGRIERFSDDGEPSGTAGAPMLNILTTQKFSNVLIVVTRYFGGILLGTGGLVKAYSAVTLEALRKANVVEKEIGKEVQLVVSYADLEKMKYYLKQNSIFISSMEYGENVLAKVEMMPEQWDSMMKNRQNLNFDLLACEMLGAKFITSRKNSTKL